MGSLARRLLLLCILWLGLMNLGFGPPAVVDAPENSLPLYASQVPAITRARAPKVSAEAWAMIDGKTGALLAGVDPRARIAPASTAKICTAIIALERGRLDDVVKVDVDSRSMEDLSTMGLLPGDRMTLRELLYGLLLPSGADAAVAVARHIGGDEQRFVALMNAKAQELGLSDTRFVNPHGDDAKDQYASPFDLATFARYGFLNPVFAAIVGTREYTTTTANRVFKLKNTNELLGTYVGADGVKTGTTEKALQVLVSTAQRDNRRVFVTVMRSDDRYADTARLLDYFFANYVNQPLDLPVSPLNTYLPEKGQPIALGPRPLPELGIPAWQARYVRPLVWLDGAVPTEPPADLRLGFVGFYLGQRLLAEVPVYAR
ncbi:MAG: D-alanyl-D-alanine carboxypeptidase family protein [Chloroflexota bacterium]